MDCEMGVCLRLDLFKMLYRVNYNLMMVDLFILWKNWIFSLKT